MRYDVTLCTLEGVARQLNIIDPTTKTLPQFILDVANSRYSDYTRYVSELCSQVSAFIMQETDRAFVPYVDSREYFHRDLMDDDLLRYGRLHLNEDLLVISALTWEGGDLTTQTISPTFYRLMPINELPYDTLRLDMRNVPTFTPDDFNAATVVTGTWGFATNLSQAYTVMQASFSCTLSETTISVTAGTADNYETFQYLKCESEMMQITHINLTTDVLTVLRGVNGTTAAAHSAVALSRFNVVEDIALAATRLAAYLWQRRTDVGAIQQLPDGTTVIAALPDTVKETLARYYRKVWLTA